MEEMEEKENKKSENKKSFFKTKNILILIIILILIVLIVLAITNIGNTKQKEKQALQIFGNEECDAIMHIATKDLVNHTCKICGEEFQDSSMRVDICTNCANETNRCDFCGKKLSQGLKARRKELIGE